MSIFFDIEKLLISGEKMLISAKLKGCVTYIFIYFWDLL